MSFRRDKTIKGVDFKGIIDRIRFVRFDRNPGGACGIGVGIETFEDEAHADRDDIHKPIDRGHVALTEEETAEVADITRAAIYGILKKREEYKDAVDV